MERETCPNEELIENKLALSYHNHGRYPDIACAVSTIRALREDLRIAQNRLENAEREARFLRKANEGLAEKVEELKPAVIHYGSIMNPWMDCLIFVPKKHVDAAFKAIKKGDDNFWNYQFEAYGDCLEAALREAMVPYEIQYAETTEDSTTEKWDEYVATLGLCGTFYGGNEVRFK